MTRTRKLLAAAGIAGLVAVGGAAIATAQTDVPDLDRAARAGSEAAGDGTGVEQDDDGSYEVDVRHADGTETEVDLDASFAVTATRHDTDTDDDDDDDGAPLDDATRARVAEAALAAAGTDGTVTEVETDDGGYDVEIRHADGTETDVHLAADLTVVSVEHDDD